MTWCPFCSHPVDSNICDCEYHTMGTLTLQPGPGLHSSHLGLGACLCIYKCANLNLTSVSSSYHCCSKHVSCLLYTSRLDSVFQTADDQVLFFKFHSTENVGATHQLQWNLSHGQPYLGVKKSTAHIRPWWPRVNAVSCTQPDFSPGLFASVYIASLINRNYNNGSVLEDTLVCKF